MLLPVVERMRLNLLSGSYIQADETTVDVLLMAIRETGWGDGVRLPDGTRARGSEEVSGSIWGDPADRRLSKIVRAAGWTHARRKFVEALKLNPQDVAAARIAVSINGLFAVDALARELSMEQRHQLRGDKSAPLLASLHEEL